MMTAPPRGVFGDLRISFFRGGIVTASVGTWGMGGAGSSDDVRTWCTSLWRHQSLPGPACSSALETTGVAGGDVAAASPVLRKHETVLFMGLLSAYLQL